MPNTQTYYVGDMRFFDAKFTSNGVYADPDTVTLTIVHEALSGAKTTTTPSPNKISTGYWTYGLLFASEGRYHVQYVGSGSVYKTLYTYVDVKDTPLN